MKTRQIACLRCGDEYEQLLQSPSHFCKPCRAKRKKEKDRTTQRALYAVRTDAKAQLAEWIDTGEIEPSYGAQLLHRANEIGFDPEWLDAASHDRMPPGAYSPSGSDDGTSTYFGDLADELDAHARQVATHPWFAANPHWAYGMNDEAEAERYLDVA